MFEMGFFASLYVWIGCLILTPVVACSKGHGGEWFFAGFFFGPLGVLAAVGLPDRKAFPDPKNIQPPTV